MSAIYDYYNTHRILTDIPPRDFVFNDETSFVNLLYEDYEGSKIPIDTKKAIGITQKGKTKYEIASVQYSALIHDCIQKTIESAKQNNRKSLTYAKDGVVLTTIGSNIIFKNRDGVENFKTNMFHLFRMVKQESSEPYGNHFLNNVLFITHNNRNCIMDYLFSLQHNLGSFYDVLIDLMTPYSNCSGSAINKKSISFLASNNDVISENVLQRIIKTEMQAIRDNMTLINTADFKDKKKIVAWEKYKSKEKIFFNIIDDLDMTDGNTNAIVIVNSMSYKETKFPGMNNPIVNPKLLIKKVKEVACTLVGFHYLIEKNIVNDDLKAELFNFVEEEEEENQEEEEKSDENYNVNQENLDFDFEAFDDFVYGSPSEGLDLNPPEEAPDQNPLPISDQEVQDTSEVQELKRHMRTYKIPYVSDLTVRPTVNPIIKSINLESDNNHILCKIIFEKELFTYTAIVDNFKKNTKYVSILKEAWWKLTNEITNVNDYKAETDKVNTWEYKGYGERPQVECYSMQKFNLALGTDLNGVSYIYNDHKVDVENKKCLYLDLVYPDKKNKCKAFVTPILVAHRYYLTNIHNLDVDKGVVWLGSTSGMSAFYCYKNAFENAGFKFDGEYKTSLYNGITFPIAYVKNDTTYYKLQTNDPTDRIFLTKEQANKIIDSEESKMIAFIRGAEVKAEYTPTASDKKAQTLFFRAKFANKVFGLMEDTDPKLFNMFIEEFKKKDGIKMDKNRVKIGTGRAGVSHSTIQNAIDSVVNDYLVKIKESINDPVDISDTNSTQWVWNQDGARADISTMNSYEQIEEWMYKDWDWDTGGKNTYKKNKMTPKEKAIFNIKNTNKIFERMYNDNKDFFKIFKDMFNNAYFSLYKINDENKLCNNQFNPMTGLERGKGAFTQEKIIDQYNYLSRSKRNFPMKYSVHMAFEKTNNDYNMLYLG